MRWVLVSMSAITLLCSAAGCGHSCQFNADCPTGQECLFMASDDSAEMCCPPNLQCQDTCCDNNSICQFNVCVSNGSSSNPPPNPP